MYIQNVYTVSTKSQPLFSVGSSIKLQLNALIFGTTISEINNIYNCEFGYDYVFHFTCVMPIPGKVFQTNYILATNKIVKQ